MTRFRPLFLLAQVYVTVSLVLRVLLWWQFGTSAGVPLVDLPGLLAIGLINDAVELVYLTLPLSFYLLLVPERLFRSRLHRVGFAIGTYLWLFAMLYLAIAEYYFFEEFDARFNLVAVDYLIYPHEVFVNIWESYPVPQALAAVGLSSALLLVFAWRRIRSTFEAGTRFRARAAAVGVHLALTAIAISGYSTQTLAHYDNRVANEIGANGLSSFFQAFYTNDLDYHVNYRTGSSDQLLNLLADDLKRGGGDFTRLEDGRLTRRFAADTAGFGKLNVVVIVLESFGAKYIGAYGHQRGLTPEFDKLAVQGLLFENTYATGTRTVRGLEAITASFPPIPSESIVKRPGSENIANWGKVMRAHGYETSFIYGGFGAFDNMNDFYRHNGFETIDRTDIEEQTFANIWGVCDEDLFRHAARHFDRMKASGEPFFSIIMSTSNHKPYTFPAGVPGVREEGGGRKAGVRYTDHALGRFFQHAPKHAWYDDTLFIVVADHGPRAYGRAEIPLKTYEIPLLIIGPGRIAPGKVETLTSQIDIAPTVLGMLGLKYEAPFFGQNVLSRLVEPRTLLFNHNHNVALFQGGELALLGLQRQARSYRYDKQHDRLTPVADNHRLIELATAYFQTAFEQFKEHRYE